MPTAGRNEQTAVALHTHCCFTQQCTAQLNLFPPHQAAADGNGLCRCRDILHVPQCPVRLTRLRGKAELVLFVSRYFQTLLLPKHKSIVCLLGFNDYSYVLLNRLLKILVSVKPAVKSVYVLLLVKPNATVLGSCQGMPQSMTCHKGTCTDSGGKCMHIYMCVYIFIYIYVCTYL